MPETNAPLPSSTPLRAQPQAGLALGLLAVCYIAAVVTGLVPQERRIDLDTLVFLTVAGIATLLLAKPDVLDRLKSFKLGSVEVQLNELREAQKQQQNQLEAIGLLLPLALPASEAEHLRNLAAHRTSGYWGNQFVRAELRRLAAMGLIERQPERRVGDIKDGGMFDLGSIVKLRPFGVKILDQLDALERASKEQPVQ